MLLRLDPRLRRRRAPQRIISYRPSSDGNRATTRGGSHAVATDLRAFLHVVEGNAERAEDARGIHPRILRRLRRRRGRSRATLGPRLRIGRSRAASGLLPRNAGRRRVGIGRSRGGRGRCRRLPRRHRRRMRRTLRRRFRDGCLFLCRVRRPGSIFRHRPSGERRHLLAARGNHGIESETPARLGGIDGLRTVDGQDGVRGSLVGVGFRIGIRIRDGISVGRRSRLRGGRPKRRGRNRHRTRRRTVERGCDGCVHIPARTGRFHSGARAFGGAHARTSRRTRLIKHRSG